MLQGIQTKWLAPTNSRGSRVKAIARKADSIGGEMSITLDWDHAQGIEGNHTGAAKALAEKLGWAGLWAGGGNPDNSGFHYVNLGREAIEDGATVYGQRDRDWFEVRP